MTLPCIKCGTPSHKVKPDGRIYRCGSCGVRFDDEIDNVFPYTDPTRRMRELEDRQERDREKAGLRRLAMLDNSRVRIRE